MESGSHRESTRLKGHRVFFAGRGTSGWRSLDRYCACRQVACLGGIDDDAYYFLGTQSRAIITSAPVLVPPYFLPGILAWAIVDIIITHPSGRPPSLLCHSRPHISATKYL